MVTKVCILLSVVNVSFMLVFLIRISAAEKEPVEDEIIQKAISTQLPMSAVDVPVDVPTEITLPGFLHAFVASLSVIIVSEIGDKTFFIAAIMAMKHSRLTVFLGAITALVLMTVLSVLFGWLATVIPRYIVYYTSTALFAIFGIKMLWEGFHMSPGGAQEEMEEVHADLRKREDQILPLEGATFTPHQDGVSEAKASGSQGADDSEDKAVANGLDHDSATANGTRPAIEDADITIDTPKIEKEVHMLAVDPESGRHRRQNVLKVVSRIFLQAFTLTFLAEWGDRSQLTTIILAAREDIYGVMLGGIVGHSLCTGVAVMGGRFVAQRISVRTVTIIGGVVFLIFALSALIFNPLSGEE